MRETTGHPQIGEWTDQVRGLIEADRQAGLDRHLADGCEACEATRRVLERVALACGADAGPQPPDWTRRSAKAYFAVRHPRSPGPWRELRLRATFDSAIAPAAAAIRARGDDRRQLLFESDEYIVELSVDQTPGASGALVCGQIFASHGEPRCHTPVFLVGGGEVLSRGISRQHGYFELDGPLDPRGELWVFPDDHSRIRLDLTPPA